MNSLGKIKQSNKRQDVAIAMSDTEWVQREEIMSSERMRDGIEEGPFEVD